MEKTHDFAQQLADELRQFPDIHDWSIRELNEHSWQLFITNQHEDTRREVRTARLTVQIFHDFPQSDPPLRGSASFTLVPSPTLRADAQRMIDQSLLMAKIVGNPSYTLPLPPAQGYPVVQSSDNEIIERPREVLDELFAAIATTISTEEQLVASATELFATTSTIHFLNSRGIDATTQSTSAALEVKLIASDGTHTAEHDLLTSRCRVRDLHIEEIMRRNARFARESLNAQLPATHKGPVVVTGEALVDMLSPLIYHTSARTAYLSLSLLHIGEPLSPTASQSTGAGLTLSTSRTLPFGDRTLAFDREGIPAMQTELIRDGIFRQYWADHRHAQYLGVPVTGSFGNIVMSPGSDPYQALISDDPTYEIVAFSWMQPDDQIGEFVAEIRLGYLHTHGEKLPIKGGSLRGNVFHAFNHFSASSETQFTGKFSGPLALRFEDLTISGGP